MNILITAGGTSEKIDGVRRITNSGTGKLGALIAETFINSVRDCRITYICSVNAVKPKASNPGRSLNIVVADDVRAVKTAVERVCSEAIFDIIIHSMAIGDYLVSAVSDAERIADNIAKRLAVCGCGSTQTAEIVHEALLAPPRITEAKISSDKENLVVVLEKAPKVIALYRGLSPGAVIVGFKLLSGENDETLVRVGHELLMRNDCDFVLANDTSTVQTDRHEGLLISRDASYERASGKKEIANLIVKRTLASAGAILT